MEHQTRAILSVIYSRKVFNFCCYTSGKHPLKLNRKSHKILYLYPLPSFLLYSFPILLVCPRCKICIYRGRLMINAICWDTASNFVLYECVRCMHTNTVSHKRVLLNVIYDYFSWRNMNTPLTWRIWKPHTRWGYILWIVTCSWYSDRRFPFSSLTLNPLCHVTKVCIFVLACSNFPSFPKGSSLVLQNIEITRRRRKLDQANWARVCVCVCSQRSQRNIWVQYVQGYVT
jgi:hypothetical protein